MTDDLTAAPAPKKPARRKPAKKRKVAKPAKPAVVAKPTASAFPHLTTTDCSSACNADGCAISGQPYCAHPCKGGLQGREQGSEVALTRFHDAQKQLGLAKIDRQ